MRSVWAALATPAATVATTLTHPSLLFAGLTTGVPYQFHFDIPHKRGLVTVGLRLGVTFPAWISASIRCKLVNAAPGTADEFAGAIHRSGTFIIGPSSPTAIDNAAMIEGSIMLSQPGTLHVIYGAEAATASGPLIQAGAVGVLWAHS